MLQLDHEKQTWNTSIVREKLYSKNSGKWNFSIMANCLISLWTNPQKLIYVEEGCSTFLLAQWVFWGGRGLGEGDNNKGWGRRKKKKKVKRKKKWMLPIYSRPSYFANRGSLSSWNNIVSMSISRNMNLTNIHCFISKGSHNNRIHSTSSSCLILEFRLLKLVLDFCEGSLTAWLCQNLGLLLPNFC